MKKLFLSLLLISVYSGATFAPNIASAGSLPIKAVLFPVKRAVLASRVSSVLNKFFFKEGEQFKKGDVIASLEDDRHLQLKEQAESEYSEAEKTLKYFELILKGNRELFQKGMQGEQDLAKNQLDFDRSKDTVQRAAARLKLADLDYQACKIVAPYAGRLIQKKIQEHEFVRPGEELCSIIDDNKLLAVLNLPQKMLNSVKIGLKVSLKIDQTDQIITGSIYTIAGKIDYNSATFEVKVLVDNSDQKLKAGMTGQLIQTTKK